MGKTRKVRVYKKGGNKPCFECGGNVFQQGGPPPEQMMQQPGQEQMMQGQPPQQQPQQPQMNPEELMQQIAQALQQGATPEEIVQGLVQEMGMPQDQAVQMVTQVIETLKSQQQQQQQPQMEQGPPMEQPPMEHGGNVFKEHPTDENNFQLRKDHISKILKSNVDDFEYDDMIKQADELMEMSYPQFKLGGEKWMQKAAKSMKKRGTIGSFKEHCGGKVTLDCIKKGLRSRNPKIRKKAGFAKASWKMAGKMQMGGLSKFQVAGQPSWKVPLPPQIYQTVTPEDNLYGNIDDDQLSIIAQYAKDKGVDVEDVQYTPQRENIKKRLFRPNQMNIDYSLNVKGQGLDDVKAQAHKDFGHMNKDMFDDWDDDSYKKYAEQAGLDYTPSEQGQMTALRNKKQERQNRKDSGVGAFERNFGRKMDGLDIANAATATTGAIAGWAQNDEQNRQRMNTAFASIPGGAGNPIDVDHQGKSGDRGDYMDEGQFRPDELGPDAYSMKNDASYFAAQKGGNIGDVTYMTDEELKKFIEGGGQVEILDY